MIDMGWLPAAAEELEEAFSPAFNERQQAIRELRGAGVAPSAIEALYPFEPFPHAETVQRLIRVPLFVTKARAPLAALDVSGSLPPQLRAQYARSFGISYNVTGTKTYTTSNVAPATSQVAQRLARGSTTLLVLPQSKLPRAPGGFTNRQQEEVGESLLRLPLLLHLCARYPFPEYADWRGTKESEFSESMVNARQHVAELTSLVHKIRHWLEAAGGH